MVAIGVRADARPPRMSADKLLTARCMSTNGKTSVVAKDLPDAFSRSNEFSSTSILLKLTAFNAPPSRLKSASTSPSSLRAGMIAAPCRPNRSIAICDRCEASSTFEICSATSLNISCGLLSLMVSSVIPNAS